MADSTRYRVAIGLAAAMLLVFYVYPLLMPIPLFDPDEGLHAAIAQEMVEGNDWVTPRFMGEPFFDKPPLYFWSQAISLKLFGMNEAAIRLPGLLFGFCGALTTGLLAWQFFGRTTGLLAGFFQTTLILPLAISQAAVHDVALVAFTNLAILGSWNSLHCETRRREFAWASFAGVMLGAACLTKGLLGVVCVFVAIGGYLLFTLQIRWRHVPSMLLAVAVGALVASPWYAMMESHHPGYLHYYIVERHLLGFLTPTQLHGREPWWYYLPILLGGGLPWIAYLPTAAVDGFLNRGELRKSVDGNKQLLLWVWLVGYLLFLCTARSKLVTYLLPLFPPLAILAADAWVRFSAGELRPAAARLLSMIFRQSNWGAPLLLPCAIVVTAWRFQVDYAWWVYGLACVASMASLLPLWRWRPDDLLGTMCKAGFALSIAFALIMAFSIPAVSEAKSAKRLAQYLNHAGKFPPVLFVANERIGSLVFYLTPELRHALDPQQICRCKIDTWRNELPGPAGSLVAVREDRIARVNKSHNITALKYQQAGHFRIYDAAEVSAVIHSKSKIADRRAAQ